MKARALKQILTMIMLIVILFGGIILYIVYGFAIYPLGFGFSDAEKAVVTYRESLDSSIQYFRTYKTGYQKWYYENGTLNECHGGITETVSIDIPEYQDAFNTFYHAGVQSVEYDENKDSIIYVFVSNMTESHGILHSTKDMNTLLANDSPYEEISLQAMDTQPGWYYYIHKTID